MGKKYNLRSGKVTTRLFRITPQAAEPAKAKQGDMYVRTGDGSLRLYTGSAWETLSSS